MQIKTSSRGIPGQGWPERRCRSSTGPSRNRWGRHQWESIGKPFPSTCSHCWRHSHCPAPSPLWGTAPSSPPPRRTSKSPELGWLLVTQNGVRKSITYLFLIKPEETKIRMIAFVFYDKMEDIPNKMIVHFHPPIFLSFGVILSLSNWVCFCRSLSSKLKLKPISEVAPFSTVSSLTCFSIDLSHEHKVRITLVPFMCWAH